MVKFKTNDIKKACSRINQALSEEADYDAWDLGRYTEIESDSVEFTSIGRRGKMDTLQGCRLSLGQHDD